MNHRNLAAGIGLALIFLVSLPCFSQSTPDRQQQIKSHLQRASEFLKQNKPELAIPEFRAIVALDPANVDAQGNLGVLLFFQGDYAQAIPPLRSALRLKPGLPKIQALLGMAEKRTGDYRQALVDLEKSFPNIKEEKIKIDAGMELVEINSMSGNLEQAATVIDALHTQYPTNPGVLYTAYRIHSDLSAQSMLSLSLVAPNSAQMHQVMAHELARQGDTASAITNYRQALSLDPNLPGLHFELAEMLNASGTQSGRKEARKEYEAALAVNQFDEKAETRLGEIDYKDGKLDDSATHYSRALHLQPNDTEAGIGLAKDLADKKEMPNAEALLEHVLQIDPTSALGHFRLATIYRLNGRMDDAKREFAEYQKYKDMKEKLGDIYKEMRLRPAKQETEEPTEAESKN